MKNLHTYPYPQQGKLVVLGAGESGLGAAMLAKSKGFDVFVSDSGTIQEQYKEKLLNHGFDFEENSHDKVRILDADLVVKSPGIPASIPLIQSLKEKNIPVIGEIEFAGQYTDAKLIGITGSNGKSTTATLTYEMLKKGGQSVGLAGNIGKSFALQVAQEDLEVYVLELSSFMLDDMHHSRLHVAVLLNITPDHLDRYQYSMDHYTASKFRIIQNQQKEDLFIYCEDDPTIATGLQIYHTPARKWPFSIMKTLETGAFLANNDELVINLPNKETFKMDIHDLSLQGKHNVYNNMASGLIAKAQELRNATMKESMGSYQNIPHRLEFVAGIAGVNYINDSKATNVNSVWYALESFSPGIVLIMGGVDKGNDYHMLLDLIKEKVSAIVCIGQDNNRIHDVFEHEVDVIINSAGMVDAVNIASHIAKKGDTVLLSPACASFDRFKNYEDRGDQFKAAVMAL